jgi:diaminopimelate decarboxylase
MAGAAPTTATRPWWERPGLEAASGRLHVAGRDAESLAREHGTPLSCEPGTWVSHLAGVLLAEVATVEERLGHRYAGLDVGWNVFNEMMVYKKPVPVIHTTAADAPPVCGVTFTGNINEGPDLFIEDHPFPEVAEGDIVALYGAGAYSLTNYMAHCLRPPAQPLFFSERLTAG